jgi:AcrR family transcriptional regulator
VPRIWSETIDAHRRAVRDATLDATAALVAEQGLTAVTMSRIAERTGIGRATLYKYFPDVEAILLAWHERQISDHLDHLTRIRNDAGSGERLHAVLAAYAHLAHQRHDTDLAALLHRGDHVTDAHRRLHAFVQDLIAEGARAGDLRHDVAADELATYCLHALTAASALPSPEAVHRLVAVTLAGLRPAGPDDTGPAGQ